MKYKYPLVELISQFEDFKKNHEEIVTHGAMNPLIHENIDKKILRPSSHPTTVRDIYKKIGAVSDEDVYFAVIKAKTHKDELEVKGRFLVVVPEKRMYSFVATHREINEAGLEMGDHKGDPLKYCDVYFFNTIYNGQRPAEKSL